MRRHVRNVGTCGAVPVEVPKPLEKPLKLAQVRPLFPARIVETADQQQVVDLVRFELHRRRGEQPQAAIQPAVSKALEELQSKIRLLTSEHSSPGRVGLVQNYGIPGTRGGQ